MSQSPTSDRSGGSRNYRLAWRTMGELIHQGRSWSGYERHCAFLNLDGVRFTDCSAVSGFDFLDDGRAIASVDWDQDGDLDLWLANRTSPAVRFLRNDFTSEPRSVSFHLEARTVNRDAIGARVELRLSDGSRRISSLSAGEGYLAQSDKKVHFGLPPGAEVSSVTVRWPGGKSETHRGEFASKHYQIVEGQAPQASALTPRLVDLSPSDLEPKRASGRARVVHAARVPLPVIEAQTDGGKTLALVPKPPRALLINLWASTCAICIPELVDFAQAKPELDELGIDLVALNVDDPAYRAQAQTLLQQLDLPFAVAFASERDVRLLELVQRSLIAARPQIALPTSFLIDAQGRLAFTYRGTVDVDTLRRDSQLLPLSARALWDASTPFAGHWHQSPPKPPIHPLARNLLFFEQHDRAEQLYRTELAANPRSPDAHTNLGVILSLQGKEEDAVEHYRRAALISPKRIRPQLNLANALRRLGRSMDAAAAFRVALEIDPTHLPARVMEIFELIRAGQWKSALQRIEQMKQYVADGTDFVHMQARILATCPDDTLRNGDEALRLINEIRRRRQSPDVMETLAMVYAEKGVYDKAVELQQQLVDLKKSGKSRLHLPKLEADLALYRADRPCRTAWAVDDPTMLPPAVDPETVFLE